MDVGEGGTTAVSWLAQEVATVKEGIAALR
jgi:hypothetical protein